jgi:adenylate cyclase
VVFRDLRGFTGFSETAEPEDVIRVLREYHEALGKVIHKYEGPRQAPPTLDRVEGVPKQVVVDVVQERGELLDAGSL